MKCKKGTSIGILVRDILSASTEHPTMQDHTTGFVYAIHLDIFIRKTLQLITLIMSSKIKLQHVEKQSGL